jgi:hypothetical protein
LLLDSVIGHRSDDRVTVQVGDEFVKHQGNKTRKKSTAGWELCVQWWDGSTSWE